MLSKEDKVIYLDKFIDILSELPGLKKPSFEVVEKYKHHYLLAPKLLYRYVKINNHTYDSIKNNYVYLSPIEALDDDFEGFVSKDEIAIDNALELLNTDKYYSYFVEKTLRNKNMYDIYSNLIFDRKKEKDKYDQYFKAKYIYEDHSGSVDDIINLSTMFDAYSNTDEIRKIIQVYANGCIKTSKVTGVCCFTENKKSQVMWNMYADNCKGCMIEYDISILDFLNIIDLTPVIYNSNRETDPFKLAIDAYLECLCDGSNIDKAINKKSYYQLLIKDEEWSFQNEWRIIGQSKRKSFSPAIKAIYLGKNIDIKNEKKLIKTAKEKKFVLYKQEFGITNKEMVYKPIYSTFDFFSENVEISSRIQDKKHLMHSFMFDDYENYLYSKKYSGFIKNEDNDIKVFVKDIKNNVTYSILEKFNNQIVGYYDVKYYDYLPTKDELLLIVNDFKYKEQLLKSDGKCDLKQRKIVIFADDYILNEITEYDFVDFDFSMILIEKYSFEVRYESKTNNIKNNEST